MSNIGLIQSIPADKQIEKLIHDKSHIDTLLSMYPDLKTIQNQDNSITYFSKALNSQLDGVEFSMSNTGYNARVHNANPFKNLKINCEYCDGNIKIFSLPSRVPLFLHYGSDYGPDKETLFYTMSYEDFLDLITCLKILLAKAIYTF